MSVCCSSTSSSDDSAEWQSIDFIAFFLFSCFVVGMVVVGVQVAVSAESLKGNSIRKVLVREAKNHGASAVVVGITRHTALG